MGSNLEILLPGKTTHSRGGVLEALPYGVVWCREPLPTTGPSTLHRWTLKRFVLPSKTLIDVFKVSTTFYSLSPDPYVPGRIDRWRMSG